MEEYDQDLTILGSNVFPYMHPIIISLDIALGALQPSLKPDVCPKI